MYKIGIMGFLILRMVIAPLVMAQNDFKSLLQSHSPPESMETKIKKAYLQKVLQEEKLKTMKEGKPTFSTDKKGQMILKGSMTTMGVAEKGRTPSSISETTSVARDQVMDCHQKGMFYWDLDTEKCTPMESDPKKMPLDFRKKILAHYNLYDERYKSIKLETEKLQSSLGYSSSYLPSKYGQAVRERKYGYSNESMFLRDKKQSLFKRFNEARRSFSSSEQSEFLDLYPVFSRILYQPGDPSWVGFCNQWTAASGDLLVNESLNSIGEGLICGGQIFRYEGIKELFTATYPTDEKNSVYFGKPETSDPSQKDEVNRLDKFIRYLLGDTWMLPHNVYKAIHYHLRNNQLVGVDVDHGPEIWNQPIVGIDSKVHHLPRQIPLGLYGPMSFQLPAKRPVESNGTRWIYDPLRDFKNAKPIFDTFLYEAKIPAQKRIVQKKLEAIQKINDLLRVTYGTYEKKIDFPIFDFLEEDDSDLIKEIKGWGIRNKGKSIFDKVKYLLEKRYSEFVELVKGGLKIKDNYKFKFIVSTVDYLEETAYRQNSGIVHGKEYHPKMTAKNQKVWQYVAFEKTHSDSGVELKHPQYFSYWLQALRPDSGWLPISFTEGMGQRIKSFKEMIFNQPRNPMNQDNYRNRKFWQDQAMEIKIYGLSEVLKLFNSPNCVSLEEGNKLAMNLYQMMSQINSKESYDHYEAPLLKLLKTIREKQIPVKFDLIKGFTQGKEGLFSKIIPLLE